MGSPFSADLVGKARHASIQAATRLEGLRCGSAQPAAPGDRRQRQS
jgi:hypothetical protein